MDVLGEDTGGLACHPLALEHPDAPVNIKYIRVCHEPLRFDQRHGGFGR